MYKGPEVGGGGDLPEAKLSRCLKDEEGRVCVSVCGGVDQNRVLGRGNSICEGVSCETLRTDSGTLSRPSGGSLKEPRRGRKQPYLFTYYLIPSPPTRGRTFVGLILC